MCSAFFFVTSKCVFGPLPSPLPSPPLPSPQTQHPLQNAHKINKRDCFLSVIYLNYLEYDGVSRNRMNGWVNGWEVKKKYSTYIVMGTKQFFIHMLLHRFFFFVLKAKANSSQSTS